MPNASLFFGLRVRYANILTLLGIFKGTINMN